MVTFLLSGGALPVAAAGVLIALAVSYAVAAGTERGKGVWRGVAQVLWLVAVAGVGYLTLVLANPNGGGVNVLPFHTILSQVHYLTLWMAAFNILGNTLVLVPFGLLARPAFGWNWLTSTLAAGAFSTAIELCQGLTGRSADVDDIMLNTLGAAVGALLSWLIAVLAAPASRLRPSPPSEATAGPGLVPLPRRERRRSASAPRGH